jgi:hypothetical protein
MAVQYVDKSADAVGTVNDTYNIGSSNDQFSIAIDGGSNQVFTLTHGAARTAAQVVADLSGLTSATASVVTINGANYVRVRTTSSSGSSSTILVNAPSNNANTILGFTATTYTGGSNVNTTFVTSTIQNVIDNCETQLLNAGWITISGHSTSNLLMQSSMSPSAQNLRMRIRIKSNSGNCATFSIENAFGTKVGNSSTSSGSYALPGSSKTWRIIANKYQAFLFVPTSVTAREFVCWGVPYVPSFLNSTIYECAWMLGNSNTDTDSSNPGRGSFRTVLGVRDNSSNVCNCQMLYNGNLWEVTNNNTNGTGLISLIGLYNGINVNNASATYYRWADNSAFLTDPLIAWGATSLTDEAQARGQLWDAFLASEAYTVDTTLSSIDSHNWWNITSNSTATASTFRGSLFVVAP